MEELPAASDEAQEGDVTEQEEPAEDLDTTAEAPETSEEGEEKVEA